jgi:hypothetical protein
VLASETASAAIFIAAISALLSAIGILVAIVLTFRNHGAIKAIGEKVDTGNTNTLGMLGAQTEGRRIQTAVPRDQRTSDQQHYVDQVPNEPS